MNDATASVSEQPLDRINGTNFRNAMLKIDSNTAKFSKTWRSKVSSLLFGFGFSLPFIFIAMMAIMTTPNLAELWGKNLVIYMLLLSLYFLFLIFLYRVASTVHCFDLTLKLYRCGNKANEKAIHLSDITCIQVIRKSIYNNSHKYDSFELNIVTKPGKRIKIIDHSEGVYVKVEAKQLAEFLKIDLMLINT